MQQENFDYRVVLRQALLKIKKRNPRYSMRAFAQRTGISPSHLSRVLNGEKNLSDSYAFRVAIELELQESERDHFLDLVSLETADEHSKKLLLMKLSKNSKGLNRRTLALESFKVIADWHHFTIYELIQTPGFQPDENWIARKLGISVLEVKDALGRLEFVGMIRKKNGIGYEVIANADVQTSDDVADLSIKKHHQQVLKKACESLSHPVETREFQSLQLPMKPKDIKKAKNMIRKFLDDFRDEFKKSAGNEIFQLSVQCFGLTKEISKER